MTEYFSICRKEPVLSGLLIGFHVISDQVRAHLQDGFKENNYRQELIW
jgi:hypothetical protein